MKLKENFVTQMIDDEQIMVAVGDNSFTGIVKSNKTAAYIIDLLKNDITDEQIVNKMLEKYDATEDVIRRDVGLIIEKLNKIGAIE